MTYAEIHFEHAECWSGCEEPDCHFTHRSGFAVNRSGCFETYEEATDHARSLGLKVHPKSPESGTQH